MRRFRSILILFVAAIMVNMAIAWACIVWSPYTSGSMPTEERTDDGYPATIAGPYGEQAWWFINRGFGVAQFVPSGARGAEGSFTYFHLRFMAVARYHCCK